jgi:hypothetical protein
MYRAQRLAEYALYDGDPTLFDSELSHYLSVTADQIKDVVNKYLNITNRVVLDIIPESLAEEEAIATPASPQPPGEPKQPTAPAPQVPERPHAQPPVSTKPEVVVIEGEPPHPEKPEQPADPPKQTTGSGPLHP